MSLVESINKMVEARGVHGGWVLVRQQSDILTGSVRSLYENSTGERCLVETPEHISCEEFDKSVRKQLTFGTAFNGIRDTY